MITLLVKKVARMKPNKYNPYENSGAYRHRITFQIPAGGIDDEGYPIIEPIPYIKVWARVKTLKGRTRYIAAQSQMENNREFGIRYTNKLDEQIRPSNLQVVWNNTVHDIVSIENDDGLNKTMTVICKAVGK